MASFNYYPSMWQTIRDNVTWPGIAVEIGTRYGHWIEQLFREKTTIERVYAVDPWHTNHGFISNLKAWSKRLEGIAFTSAIPLRGASEHWCQGWPESLPIDLLYIDGAHSYKHVALDLLGWWPHVRKGGLVMLHDVHNEGVCKAVTEFFERRQETIHLGSFGPKKPGFEILTAWTVKAE